MINKYTEFEISEFIFKVFETFKHWICPNIEPIILCSYDVEVACRSNNIIYVNIDDILNRNIACINNYEEYILETKRFILEVIIHELYHVEQDIVNVRYNTNISYRSDIEHQVIYMTLIFILKNSYYIKQMFGVYINEELIRNKINTLVTNHSIFYNRFIDNNESFYINALLGIIDKGCNKDLTMKYITNFIKDISTIKNIIVIINNIKYIVKKNYVFNNNYNELNILNKYTNSTSLIGEIKTDVLFNDDTCLLQVKDESLKSLFTTLKRGEI